MIFDFKLYENRKSSRIVLWHIDSGTQTSTNRHTKITCYLHKNPPPRDFAYAIMRDSVCMLSLQLPERIIRVQSPRQNFTFLTSILSKALVSEKFAF